MNLKALNLLVYTAIIGSCAVVYFQTTNLDSATPGGVGSGFFPANLAILAIVLCGVGAVRTVLSSESGTFEVANFKRLCVTTAIIAIWISAWQTLGQFYLFEFLFLSCLIAYYRWPIGMNWRHFGSILLLSAIVTATSYIIFNRLIYVDL